MAFPVRLLAIVLPVIAGLPAAARAEAFFLRGDANGDGQVDISDAASTLAYLFLGSEPPPCPKAADADDSGAIDLTDPIYTLTFLFLGGVEIPPPGPWAPGIDPTADDLGCPSGERAMGGAYGVIGLQVEIHSTTPYGSSSISGLIQLDPDAGGAATSGSAEGNTMKATGACPFAVEVGKNQEPLDGRLDVTPGGTVVMRNALGDRGGAASADGWAFGVPIDHSDAFDTGTIEEGRGFLLSVKRPSLTAGDPAMFLAGDYGVVIHWTELLRDDHTFQIVGDLGTASVDGIKKICSYTGASRFVAADFCDLTAPLVTYVEDDSVDFPFEVSPDGGMIFSPDNGPYAGFVSADGELFTFADDDDVGPAGDIRSARRGLVFGVKRGGRMSLAGLRGAYRFHGAESRLRQSGELVVSSLPGVLVLDGKGGISGGLEERWASWTGYSSPPAGGYRWDSFDGASYAVTADGAVQVRRAEGTVLDGFASASGQWIILSTDFDEEAVGVFGRGFLIGFRRPPAPPPPEHLIAFYQDDAGDDLTVIGKAVPGAAGAAGYRLFRSFDGAAFEEEAFPPENFTAIQGAFGIATRASGDVWYKVRATVGGRDSAFSNAVFLPRGVRGALPGLKIEKPAAGACAPSARPEIAWSYGGPAAVGSYCILVEREVGPGRWTNHALVAVGGTSWTYGTAADVIYVLTDLEPGACHHLSILALDPEGTYLGHLDPENSGFAVPPCGAPCP